MILIFSFKVFQYIPRTEKKNYFKEIETLYKDKNDYTKFIKYFEKNWFNNKFLDFEFSNKETNRDRTNNVCENYHRNLKNIINSYHPKISYYVDKIKDYTISSFNHSKLELANINKNEKTCNNLYYDIYKFVNKIYKKYKIPFSIKFWNRLEKSETYEIFFSLNNLKNSLSS